MSTPLEPPQWLELLTAGASLHPGGLLSGGCRCAQEAQGESYQARVPSLPACDTGGKYQDTHPADSS